MVDQLGEESTGTGTKYHLSGSPDRYNPIYSVSTQAEKGKDDTSLLRTGDFSFPSSLSMHAFARGYGLGLSHGQPVPVKLSSIPAGFSATVVSRSKVSTDPLFHRDARRSAMVDKQGKSATAGLPTTSHLDYHRIRRQYPEFVRVRLHKLTLSEHIVLNVLELRAAYQALLTFRHLIQGRAVMLKLDNVSAVAFIRRQPAAGPYKGKLLPSCYGPRRISCGCRWCMYWGH